MSSSLSPVEQCYLCGYRLKGRKGIVCNRCFNAVFFMANCKFCGKRTLVSEKHIDNENVHVCMDCDWENRSDLKCDVCGNIGKDAMYSSHYYSKYTCKSCCHKTLLKCAECSIGFYGLKQSNNRDLCRECRLKHYIPHKCVTCNRLLYFHKFRRPGSCVCNTCYVKKHDNQ